MSDVRLWGVDFRAGQQAAEGDKVVTVIHRVTQPHPCHVFCALPPVLWWARGAGGVLRHRYAVSILCFLLVIRYCLMCMFVSR